MFFLLFLFLSSYAQNITVDSSDPSIVYQGQWTDQDNGGHRFATTPGSSLSLTFQGIAVYWHSRKNPIAAVSNVSLDTLFAATVDPSQGFTNTSQLAYPAVLFSRENLKNTTHTLQISYVGIGSLGGPYLESFFFEYTQAPIASPTHTNTAALAGGLSVLALVVLSTSIALAVILYRRRRQRQLKTSQARAPKPYDLNLPSHPHTNEKSSLPSGSTPTPTTAATTTTTVTTATRITTSSTPHPPGSTTPPLTRFDAPSPSSPPSTLFLDPGPSRLLSVENTPRRPDSQAPPPAYS